MNRPAYMPVRRQSTESIPSPVQTRDTAWMATTRSNGAKARSVIVHRQNWYDARRLAATLLGVEPGALDVVEVKP